MSSQPCGCDPDYVGEHGYDSGNINGWVCEQHRKPFYPALAHLQSPPQQELTRPTNPITATVSSGVIRIFDTGATRDQDATKPDFEGYLSPLALDAFGDYMTAHRIQPDGSVRDSDNWQKGIPLNAYIKSLLRHVFQVWRLHRGYAAYERKPDGSLVPVTKREALCAILFNTQGYLHELIKQEEKL